MKKILTTVSALLLTLSLVGCGSAKTPEVVYQDENVIITVGKDAVAENLTDGKMFLEYKQKMYGKEYDMVDIIEPHSRGKLYYFDKEGEIFYKITGGK